MRLSVTAPGQVCRGRTAVPSALMTSIAERLDARIHSGSGGEPLITYYGLSSDERTELSATTFGNWVNKTANLLGALAIGEGDMVRLELCDHAPGHWVTLVWAAACWRAGATVAAVPQPGRIAAVVVGPDWMGYETSTATEIIACSLHPLGLGFPDELPTGVLDYSLEVRAQPDLYAGSPTSHSNTAWVDETRSLTAAQLADEGADEPPLRRLVRPTDPWTTVSKALLTPLNSGGSIVIVVGDDSAKLSRLYETERIDR
jgi:uncharacterized protein (TIGR03089 family)